MDQETFEAKMTATEKAEEMTETLATKISATKIALIGTDLVQEKAGQVSTALNSKTMNKTGNLSVKVANRGISAKYNSLETDGRRFSLESAKVKFDGIVSEIPLTEIEHENGKKLSAETIVRSGEILLGKSDDEGAEFLSVVVSEQHCGNVIVTPSIQKNGERTIKATIVEEIDPDFA